MYQVFGSDNSPYSIKVRAYFDFKGVPFKWIIRSQSNEEAYRKVARLAIVPAVRLPDGKGLQDSTPIMSYLDRKYPSPPERSAHPPTTLLSFVSFLLEEFGDEWGNKWMFHLRWARPVDQVSLPTEEGTRSNTEHDDTENSRASLGF